MSVPKADREALAAAGLLGVSKSKSCAEVLTSESDNDSENDDNGAPDCGGMVDALVCWSPVRRTINSCAIRSCPMEFFYFLIGRQFAVIWNVFYPLIGRQFAVISKVFTY